MVENWRPGLIAERLAAVGAAAEANLASALEELAQVIERQAKVNASSGSHRRGTKTPAQQGSGPAIITGTLRRSIVHTKVERSGSDEMEIKVGMAAGVYPPTGGGKRGRGKATASSKYGFYLDQVLDYPFLTPAYRFAVTSVAPGIWKAHFNRW